MDAKLPLDFELRPPRHAFSPRQVARPAELWRLFQEAAVLASTARGWPPPRYLAEGVAFLVTGMTARHHAEVRYGETLSARTWLRDFRRGILSKRQVELWRGPELVAECTQQWVHVDASMKPSRASAQLAEAFPKDELRSPVVTLPEPTTPFEGRTSSYRFQAWQSWMDPLGHANHPAYLEYCEEGLARAAASAGRDPHGLVPVGERITWKAGIVAGDEVVVDTRMVGLTEQGDSVLKHQIGRWAKATTVRRGDLSQLFRP